MYQNFQWTRASEMRNQLTRCYEPVQPFLLVNLAQATGCTIFVDVGANVGAYSLFLSLLPSIQRVHAFEPSPETFDELRRNVELNTASETIIAHNMAVSDNFGELLFGIVGDLSGANSVIGTSIHATNKFKKSVPTFGVPLDAYLEEKGERICIKIDVEGHEMAALRGMKQFLVRNSVIMQIENYGRDSDELTQTLTELNFNRIFKIGPDHYFSNMQPTITDREIITILEDATSSLVESNLVLAGIKPNQKKIST